MREDSHAFLEWSCPCTAHPLRACGRRSRAERSCFHDPKSLLLALVGEVGELSEIFQWLPADEAAEIAGRHPLRRDVEDELADVLLYLVRLADVLGVDLAAAAEGKMLSNAVKHPPGFRDVEN
ncbi:MAG TPA: nucleotide pyrophosphohydrolase [Nocardioidaceae bacterium]|nr:nucleotide pyrophosphohydrolase [Nocardioidaceae bacterium]